MRLTNSLVILYLLTTSLSAEAGFPDWCRFSWFLRKKTPATPPAVAAAVPVVRAAEPAPPPFTRSTKIEDAKVAEGPVPDANRLAEIAAASREAKNLVSTIQMAPRAPEDLAGSPLKRNEDLERLLAMGDRALIALKAGKKDDPAFKAFVAELRRDGERTGRAQDREAADTLAHFLESEAYDPKTARRLEQLLTRLRNGYESGQAYQQAIGNLLRFSSLLGKALEEIDPVKRQKILDEADALSKESELAGGRGNRKVIEARNLGAAFERDWGKLEPTGGNLEKAGWIARNEAEIASKSAEFLRTLKTIVGNGRKIEEATQEEIEKATATVWPRPPKPAPAPEGASSITRLGNLSIRPVANGFAMRSPHFVLEVISNDLVGRAARLSADPRIPAPRREFLENYLRLLKRWKIPMEEGDQGIKSVVVFLEELYPPPR